MAAHQAPPSLGFSRQEHWGGLPFPSPMHESEKSKWSRSVVSTLSDLMDCSLPGSSVHGIFQARILEWGAIAFSEPWVGTKSSQQWLKRRKWKTAGLQFPSCHWMAVHLCMPSLKKPLHLSPESRFCPLWSEVPRLEILAESLILKISPWVSVGDG